MSQALCWLFAVTRHKQIRHSPCLHGAFYLVGEVHINQIIILSLNTYIIFFTSCHSAMKEKYRGVIKACNMGTFLAWKVGEI